MTDRFTRPLNLTVLNLTGALFLILTAAIAGAAGADQPDQLKFFEGKVRPLLIEKCQKCHGSDKQSGGLRLDIRSGFLKGGESGPSLVPGKPDESLLIEAIQYGSFEMPPTGKMSDEEIAILTKWVRDGAWWPDEKEEPAHGGGHGPRVFTDEDRQWWAFQPVQSPQVPAATGNGWARNEIDRFVLQKLNEKNLTPAPEADRRTLIRRLTFDLTGLPPTAEEIDAFVTDSSADAYERLVERLLQSPRYGEHLARHWLDLVRYNESDGYRQDAYRPDMWRYRDYVIRSFNSGKPYDRFVQEQIAGDELDPDNPDALVATSYWRLFLYEYNQRDVRTHWRAIIDELTDVSGEVFLGMSLGCAKCHDHKFDPILREDYFRFQAFFSSMLPQDTTPMVDRPQRDAWTAKMKEWETATAEIRAQIAEIERPYRERARLSAVKKFPPDIKDIALKPQSEWSAHDWQLMDLVDRQAYLETEKVKLKEDDQKKVEPLLAQLKTFDHFKPQTLPVALTVRDALPVPAATIMPGDRKQLDILPGILTILNPDPMPIDPVTSAPQSTGRRLALARWLTQPDNPLSTRVIANRIWQFHFGTGLTATSSDFGRLGEKPSHPELLDWLTRYFVEHGWDFRTMHRLIVNSATYRQSATHPDPEAAMKIDPQNRLRWRSDVRRLRAEQIRDAMLATSGELQHSEGGPSVDGKTPRRSVYLKSLRNSPDALMSAFDAADGFNSTALRGVTTTATQSLLMINGEWTMSRAVAMADRIDRLVAQQRSPGSEVNQQIIEAAVRTAFGRAPADAERNAGRLFLSGKEPATDESSPPVTAAHIQGGQSGLWQVEQPGSFPQHDFTVEAIIELTSLYPDATVRTIVSHWDGENAHPGWSFGVTSTRSAYEPRNLILQLVGTTSGAETLKYEVIPSGLRPELNRRYYAAVSVDIDDPSPAGITFYLRDLSQPDAPLQTASVAHTVTGGYRPDVHPVVGDRDSRRRSRWDGRLDDVRVSSAALKADELLILGGAGSGVVAFWNFDDPGQPGRDVSGLSHHLKVPETSRGSLTGVAKEKLIDFCHVLLNSNEFLYLD